MSRVHEQHLLDAVISSASTVRRVSACSVAARRCAGVAWQSAACTAAAVLTTAPAWRWNMRNEDRTASRQQIAQGRQAGLDAEVISIEAALMKATTRSIEGWRLRRDAHGSTGTRGVLWRPAPATICALMLCHVLSLMPHISSSSFVGMRDSLRRRSRTRAIGCSTGDLAHGRKILKCVGQTHDNHPVMHRVL